MGEVLLFPLSAFPFPLCCYDTAMPRTSRDAALEQAYPGVTFRPHTRGLFARMLRTPAECSHLETDQSWMAALVPDTVWLKNKPHPQRIPPRPEASLCRACLLSVVEPELAKYEGRVVLFEPNAEDVTQYFFVSAEHFEDAYLQGEVVRVLRLRLGKREGRSCEHDGCARTARWLWFSQREVASLEESALIEAAPGTALCARHGAARLCEAFRAIPQANLEFFNLPYGEAGAYVWF